jgi:hypothetical protein
MIEDPALSAQRREKAIATACARDLREAVNGAIQRQAARWGIRPDQAQVLLLDHRMPA